MKQWPEGDKSASFTDLSSVVRKLFTDSFSLKEKDGPVALAGFDTNPSPSSCFDAAEQLSPEQLEHHLEQGRDKLDILVMIALWIGMEQGRRKLLCELQNQHKLSFLLIEDLIKDPTISRVIRHLKDDLKIQ